MLTENEKKYCPGLIHLRARLRTLAAATGADKIRVFDGEEVENYAVDEAGVIAASEFAPELDGEVYYSVGKATIVVIYDGPYGEHNAAEIINDTNELADEILKSSV